MTLRLVAFVMAMCAAGAARGQPLKGGRIEGLVSDAATGAPVFGATITVASTARQDSALTDETGRYEFALPAGEYTVLVIYDAAKVEHAGLIVKDGETNVLRDHVDASGTVITIKEKAPAPEPTKPAEPTHESATRQAPYSDEAVLHDVWGLAWLLLDVDPTGRVVRVKFFKRPGHGLDEIAVNDAWKLRFTPARDDQGRPMSARVMWKMEWMAASRKELRTEPGTNPKVPCQGAGPMNLTSIRPGYRDCSPPDYALGAREPWIDAPGQERPPAAIAPTLQSACDRGEAAACYDLSVRFEDGDGVKADPARAQKLEEDACTAGLGAACFSLGVRYIDGRAGIVPDRAAALFEQACRKADEEGCELTRLHKAHGDDFVAAVRGHFYQRSCTDRDARGCYNMALQLQRREPARAVELYRRACEAGVAIACSNLGLMAQGGEGMSPDLARAAALFERACDADEAAGCTNLGHLLMGGPGQPPRDAPRARAALEKSCAAGEQVGCYNLSIALDWGIGGERDEKRSRALRLKACRGGVTAACNH